MFQVTTPAPSAPAISTTTSPVSPTTASRTGRLRGLSYLRNYTQAHLHARSDIESTGRTPRPSGQRSRAATSSGDNGDSLGSEIVRSPSPSSGNTSGWLPTVAGRAGLTRVSARQQHSSNENASASAEPAPAVTTSASSIPAPKIMARTRAETAAPVLAGKPNGGATGGNVHPDSPKDLPSIRFIPHFDPRASRPSLSFPAITRTLPDESAVIRVGRYSERENMPEANPSVPSAAPVGFKSKVVSRRHCEFWCHDNQWYIKDVKSSSGTFLNHLRLSPPGSESKPWPIKDGDVVQLGIDFRGGEEMIFRCVKIRIECNRGWQKGLNNFNKSTHKRLQNLAKKKDSDTASVNSSECAICLMSIAPCQSLFVAPCSHVWHYKCIRPILNGQTWPNFLCPNCRAVADLDADVDDVLDEWDNEDEVIEASKREMRSANVTNAPSTASSNRGETASVNSTRALHQVPSRDTAEIRGGHGASDHSTDEEDDLQVLLGLTNMALHQSGRSDHASTEIDTPSASDRSQSSDPDRAGISSNAMSTPRAIPSRHATGNGAGSSHATPDRTITRDVLAPGPISAEGPMTPRNDVGPFVLDGGAGHRSSLSRARGGTPSNSDPALASR